MNTNSRKQTKTSRATHPSILNDGWPNDHTPRPEQIIFLEACYPRVHSQCCRPLDHCLCSLHMPCNLYHWYMNIVLYFSPSGTKYHGRLSSESSALYMYKVSRPKISCYFNPQKKKRRISDTRVQRLW